MTLKSKNELWLKQYWRPAMAWQYFVVCLYDFLLAPLIYNHISLISHEKIVQWDPITLQAGGLYHIAMAAIIGIYTWTRGLEKMEMIKNRIIPLSHSEKIHEFEFSDDDEFFNPPEDQYPQKRKRGRPRKIVVDDERDY